MMNCICLLYCHVIGVFTPELRKNYTEILNKNGVKLQTIDYPDTVHGFASRPRDGSEGPMNKRQQAQDAAVNFFKSNL
jgi:hypothetical protein